MRALSLAIFVVWPSLTSTLVAQKAAADSTIVVELNLQKPEAIERVMATMSDAGLQIAQSEATGLVVGVGDGPKNTTVRYSAAILPTGEGTRVVLSADATSKTTVQVAAASFTPKIRVTSKTKGGAKVWNQLERLADAIRR